MAEGDPFPLFTNCRLTINSKVATGGGKLYKLLTNELKFRIVGYDPLVIEKECPSQDDIEKVFDGIRSLCEARESGDQTVKQNVQCNMREATNRVGVSQLGHMTGEYYELVNNAHTEDVTHETCKESQSSNTAVCEDFLLLSKENIISDMNIPLHGTDKEKQTRRVQDREKDRDKKCIEVPETQSQRESELFHDRLYNFVTHDVINKETDKLIIEESAAEYLTQMSKFKELDQAKISNISNEDVKCKQKALMQDTSSSVHNPNSRSHVNNNSVPAGYGLDNNDTKDVNSLSEDNKISAVLQSAFASTEDHLPVWERCDNVINSQQEFQSSTRHHTDFHLVRSAQDEDINSLSAPIVSGTYSDDKNGYCVVSDVCKLSIQIYRANITELQVDCIVNAANENLQHWGGVAKAISEAAGSALRKECDDYTKDGRVLDVTGTFMSTAGKLSAKCVMHAVGPRWDSYDKENKHQCFTDLRHTVIRCLVEANRRKITSIAFPSISAAIFRVPKEQCARCYMEAVKHFDMLSVGDKLTLKEIHFVDVDDAVVDIIAQCFGSSWSKLSDMEIVLKDAEFVEQHLKFASGNEMKDCHRLSVEEIRCTDDKSILSSVLTEDVAEAAALITSQPLLDHSIDNQDCSSSLKKDQSNVSQSLAGLGAGTCDISASYQFGKTTLHVDSRHAFDLKSDVIFTVGKPFDKLSGAHDFSMSASQKLCKNIRSEENRFTFYNVSQLDCSQSRFLCEVLPEPDKVETITQAFGNLKAAIQSCKQLPKALTITSSVLYADPSNEQQQKGNRSSLHAKNVATFAVNLCNYLDNVSEDITIFVAGSEGSLPIIQKVAESHNVMNMVPTGVAVTVDTKNACSFCGENTLCECLACCEKWLCRDCEKNASACPFCHKLRKIITGDQPPGLMTVSLIDDYADGYENIDAWEIEYYFPAGEQKEWHPCPGKPYASVRRIAYLPANDHGYQVLLRLRLAFIRNLIFTIGHSDTRNRDNVIVWDGISHKTSLHGKKYGYPDPDYLSRVMLELANKGVQLTTSTAAEKKKLSDFDHRIKSFNSFSDGEFD